MIVFGDDGEVGHCVSEEIMGLSLGQSLLLRLVLYRSQGAGGIGDQATQFVKTDTLLQLVMFCFVLFC